MKKTIQWATISTALAFAMVIPVPADAADHRAAAGQKHLKHTPGKMHKPARATARQSERGAAYIGETEKNQSAVHSIPGAAAGVLIDRIPVAGLKQAPPRAQIRGKLRSPGQKKALQIEE